MEEIIGLQEAAKLLAVQPITLRKWDREGKLRAIRVGSRGDRRYRKSDLLNFLDSSNTKIEWQEYIRNGITIRHVDPIMLSVTEGQREYFGRGLNHLMCYFEGGTMFWYYDKNDLLTQGRTIVKKLIDLDFREYYLKRWNRVSAELLDLTTKNSLNTFGKINDKSLIELYYQFTKSLAEFYKVTIIIDSTDEALMVDMSRRIRAVLKDHLGDEYKERDFSEVYNVISTPTKLSYMAAERIALLLLYKKIKERGMKTSDKEFSESVNAILLKYWWTNLGWAKGQAKNSSDILNEIEEIEKSEVDYNKELADLYDYEKETSLERQRIIKKFGLLDDPLLMSWIELYDELVEYHDFRKEVQMKANFWEYQFLEEVEKRTGFPGHLLNWCTVDEVALLISGQRINENELNMRSSRYFCLYEQGKELRLTGRQAEIKRAETLNLEKDEIRDLQGMSACPGTVTGEAYVAITPKTASEIKKGQILVTGMTTPDYLPAVKKAAGLVTDEGGITCHAAIISRELNTPCIVGTRYATKIISTGDIIEVRANHGIIRILKKSNQK